MTLKTDRFNEIYENPEQCSYSEIQEMAAMLANREAQPVGFTSDSYMCELKNSGVVHAWLRRDGDDPGFNVKLYTAPPAPAVPEEMTKEDAMAFVRERPPFKGSVDCVLATWNACRAAMLAQPVSKGYKLVPVEPTEEMIAAAMNCDDVEFNSDETFCVNFDNIYRAMLATAQEVHSND